MDLNTLRTPLEALQFAIEFAQMDFSKASAVQVKAVEQRTRELIRLPGRPPPFADGSGQNFVAVPRLDRAALERLQVDAYALLAGIVRSGSIAVNLNLVFWAGRPLRYTVQPRSHADLDQIPRDYSPEVVVAVSGPPRDRLIYRVIRLLEELGVERLRECPAPECGRLFFKVTRKEYCSTRCQSRIYMRSYREPPKPTTSAVTKTHRGRKAQR